MWAFVLPHGGNTGISRSANSERGAQESLVRLKKRIRSLLSRIGIGRGKRLQLEQARSVGMPIRNLHLGCGHIHLPGWCNVDVLSTGATDLIMEIDTLPGLAVRSVSKIYSCHVLEHFSTDEIPAILKRWFDVLEYGGELRISVPDLDAITRIYQKNFDHFQVPGHQPWIALIYGGQKDKYDFHKTGFNFCWLSYLLSHAGFANISRYPNEPHFVPEALDNSMAKETFGEYISLNVMARKPGRAE